MAPPGIGRSPMRAGKRARFRRMFWLARFLGRKGAARLLRYPVTACSTFGLSAAGPPGRSVAVVLATANITS